MPRLLCTGGLGFLGSHICERFKKRGWEVTAFDNMTKFELSRTGYNTDACRDYNYNFLNSLGVEIVQGDITDMDALLKAVGTNCDFIIHTAAQPAITISVDMPTFDFRNNAMGTLYVLEVCRAHKIPMVNCATIHVYGNTHINNSLGEGPTRYVRSPVDIPESFPIAVGDLTPLHASKIAADTYVRAYINTYEIKAATFRLTGLYGPRQFGGEDHGWMANFTIRTLTNKPITIYGSGKQVRDVLFATDAAWAFECWYYNQKPGVYNIGGGPKKAISLLECTYILESITGIKPVIEFKEDRIGDLRYFVCDITKAQEHIGWDPIVDPRYGLVELSEWVKENKELFSGN